MCYPTYRTHPLQWPLWGTLYRCPVSVTRAPSGARVPTVPHEHAHEAAVASSAHVATPSSVAHAALSATVSVGSHPAAVPHTLERGVLVTEYTVWARVSERRRDPTPHAPRRAANGWPAAGAPHATAGASSSASLCDPPIWSTRSPAGPVRDRLIRTGLRCLLPAARGGLRGPAPSPEPVRLRTRARSPPQRRSRWLPPVSPRQGGDGSRLGYVAPPSAGFRAGPTGTVSSSRGAHLSGGGAEIDPPRHVARTSDRSLLEPTGRTPAVRKVESVLGHDGPLRLVTIEERRWRARRARPVGDNPPSSGLPERIRNLGCYPPLGWASSRAGGRGWSARPSSVLSSRSLCVCSPIVPPLAVASRVTLSLVVSTRRRGALPRRERGG